MILNSCRHASQNNLPPLTTKLSFLNWLARSCTDFALPLWLVLPVGLFVFLVVAKEAAELLGFRFSCRTLSTSETSPPSPPLANYQPSLHPLPLLPLPSPAFPRLLPLPLFPSLPPQQHPLLLHQTFPSHPVSLSLRRRGEAHEDCTGWNACQRTRRKAMWVDASLCSWALKAPWRGEAALMACAHWGLLLLGVQRPQIHSVEVQTM